MKSNILNRIPRELFSSKLSFLVALIIFLSVLFKIVGDSRLSRQQGDLSWAAINGETTEETSQEESFDVSEEEKADLSTLSSAGLTADSSLATDTSSTAADHVIYEIVQGDTLQAVLAKFNLSSSEQDVIIRRLRQLYDPSRLSIGQKIEFFYLPVTAGQSDVERQLDKIVIRHRLDKKIEISRENDSFSFNEIAVKLDKKLNYVSAEIDGSLFAAGLAQNVPEFMLNKLVALFSYDIDFSRDIHAGDRMDLIYEEYKDEEGKRVKTGNLVYAALNLQNKSHKLYGYQNEPGSLEYFDESGNIARKALLRTPLDFIRVSSKYGKRKHPVLGYSLMHKGVDFAAPVGTPIYAAGSGKVVKMGRYGAYGNLIEISHGSGFTTVYAHLSKFSRKLKKGVKVKQGEVIGYTGRTGRVTGPHLHYEIKINGKHVNPLQVKLAPTLQLSSKKLTNFKHYVTSINSILGSNSDKETTMRKLEKVVG